MARANRRSFDARSFRTILTDAGRSLSSHPLENNDCSIRAVSLVTGLTYDEAWDELAGHGRIPMDGFMWEDWARKVGFIQAPWTGQPEWVFKRTSFPPMKGFERIRPRNLPSLFPQGRFIMTSTEHVEAWIGGRHYDHPNTVRLLNPERIIFGAWECRRIAKDQRLYMAYRCYFLDEYAQCQEPCGSLLLGGPCPDCKMMKRAFRSALGPVPAVSHQEAYRTAEKWYGHLVQLKNSDMLVERL